MEELDKELPPLPELEMLNMDMMNNKDMEGAGMGMMDIPEPQIPEPDATPIRSNTTHIPTPEKEPRKESARVMNKPDMGTISPADESDQQ